MELQSGGKPLEVRLITGHEQGRRLASPGAFPASCVRGLSSSVQG
jgi:hypothetical protein